MCKLRVFMCTEIRMDISNFKKISVRGYPSLTAFNQNKVWSSVPQAEYGDGKTWLDESTISLQVSQHVRLWLYGCNGIAIGYLVWSPTLDVQKPRPNASCQHFISTFIKYMFKFYLSTHHMEIMISLNYVHICIDSNCFSVPAISLWNHSIVILALSAAPNFIFGYSK